MITTTTTSNYYNVSDKQLDAVTKTDSGWEVTSSTGEGYYTIAHNTRYNALTCNCRAGQEGMRCWHKRAVLQSIAIEQDAAASEQHHAAREARAVAQDGLNAYNRKPFSLLAS